MKNIDKIIVLVIVFYVMLFSTGYSVCSGGLIILDSPYYDGLRPYSVYNSNLMDWGNVYYSGQRYYRIRNGGLMGWSNAYYGKKRTWGRYDIDKQPGNNDDHKSGSYKGCGGYDSNGLNGSYSKHRYNYKQNGQNNVKGGPHDPFRRSHRHRPSKYRFLSR